MSLSNQFLQDVETVVPTNDELGTISKLAIEQRDLEQQIAQLETELTQAKESLRQVQEFLLPQAMASVGLSEFKLIDGSKLTIRDDVYASIRKDKITEAVTWLDQVGLGDIVKDKIDVNFGRGESHDAKKLIDYCHQHGLVVNETLSVHPQTLKATVKEQLARGVEFPEECFSIAPVKKAILKAK